MKKTFLIALAVLFIGSSLNAQKIYSTRTAKITFFSKAPLEDIEAKNSEVDSKLSTDGQIVFKLLIKGFRFENALMEDHFNENYMESSKYPKSMFSGQITNLKFIDFNKDGSYPVKVKGKLTIRDINKDVEATGTIDIKDGKVSSKSNFSINLKDYGITGSNIGSKIAETINVQVDAQYQ
jgi:hypothetical protein